MAANSNSTRERPEQHALHPTCCGEGGKRHPLTRGAAGLRLLRSTNTSYSSMLWLSYLGSGRSRRMPLAMLSATSSSVRGAERAIPDMSNARDPVLFTMEAWCSSPRKCDMRHMGDKLTLLLPPLLLPSPSLTLLGVAALAARPPRFAGRGCLVQPGSSGTQPARSLGRAVPALFSANRICNQDQPHQSSAFKQVWSHQMSCSHTQSAG